MPEAEGPPPGSELVFYQTEDGQSRLQVRLEGGTVWLTQLLLADLFQTTKQNISLHIKHIFEEGELDPSATVKQSLTVQTEGSRQVRRAVDHDNLELILAVGYRVRSHRGTQFRRWATERLREYLVKGFVLNDERLKAGRSLGADYFDELLERIRDIRASEKRFYQKILFFFVVIARTGQPRRPDCRPEDLPNFQRATKRNLDPTTPRPSMPTSRHADTLCRECARFRPGG